MPRLKTALKSCAAVLALGTLAPLGLAQRPPDAAPGETLWLCWYNHDSTFRCRLAQAAELPVAARAKPPEPARASPRRSLYPKRGPLPPIVKTIHEQPARLHGRMITIPLFTPPRDLAFTAVLIQSVMCDVQPACRAVILRSSVAAIEAFEEDPARD